MISNEEDTRYTWRRYLEAAPWPADYNFQMLVVNNSLWVLHNAGNWHSSDGFHWTKSWLPNAVGDLRFLDYVVFNDQLFALGHAEGDIMSYEYRSVVSVTSNMDSWTIITDTNLPKIVYYHPFAFKNKLWIIGGDDGLGTNADIWVSDDGVHWIKVDAVLPFGKRSGSQFVVFRDRVYLIDNDVWSSGDAIHWIRVTAEIIPGELAMGHHALVFDNAIWLIGYSRDGNLRSEVLISADGATWTAVDMPWPARGSVAACVFQNKLFLTGGKFGGWPSPMNTVYYNDLWIMEKSE